jgi:hypothetical protein
VTTLGQRIQTALDWRDWTQADFLREAEKRGYDISSGMLSKWLNDKAVPLADQLVTVREIIGCSGHYLLTDEKPVGAPGKRPELLLLWELGWKACARTMRQMVTEAAEPPRVDLDPETGKALIDAVTAAVRKEAKGRKAQ